MNEAASAPAALSAFLRGVERRGAVFAHLQVGDEEAGMLALASAMEAFRAAAARTAFGDWPRRFWSLLLAAPQLREPATGGHWPPEFEVLGRVGRGPRAALLLRLVAHVSEADAAAVLGVSRSTYRMALRRALPRQADGSPDAEAWRLLAEAAQQTMRELPPDTRAELAQVREAALKGHEWTPAPAPSDDEPDRGRPGWVWPASALVVVATLAGLVAVQLAGGPAPGPQDGPEHIVRESLPPATRSGEVLDEDLALAMHPDFELLAADAQEPAMRAPGLHAWLVHQLEDLSLDDLPPAGTADAPTGPVPAHADAGPATVMPPALQEHAAALPADEAERVARRHAQLQAMSAQEKAAARRRVARWEALDLAAQRARRDDWHAWNRLPADARDQMRAAAAAYAALPEERRHELAEAFAGLDELERNGWRLGPELGADWPTLHPLFALVPAAQQEELLAVLTSMDGRERADLGVLAQRTPPGERDALRDQLLTTPVENRAAWLRGAVTW